MEALSFASIVIASVLGSIHCVGMCGGFVALAAQRPYGQVAYHLGRGGAYVILGFLAGWIGSSINSFGVLAGVQALAPLVVSLLLIGAGVALLWHRRLFTSLEQIVGVVGARVGRFALSRKVPSGVVFGALLGASTGFLPCGWLWSFVAFGVGTGDPWKGVLALFCFWLGTLPALNAIGFGVRKLSQTWLHLVPTISALLIVTAGIFSLVTHLMAAPHGSEHRCYEEPGTLGQQGNLE